MRGARLYVIIAIIVLSLFLIVMVNSCRRGNHPQSDDDLVPVAPPSTMVDPLGLRTTSLA